MGMFKRMSEIFGAKMNRLLDQADDPRESLDYAYEKQLEMLKSVKQGIVEIAAAKRQLMQQAGKIEVDIATRERQAQRAVDAGRDDLALTALERKLSSENDLAQLREQIASTEEEQAKLTRAEQRLQAQVNTYRNKKEIVKAQYSAAQAQARIGASLGGISDDTHDAVQAMQRAEIRIDRMKAQAGAIDELTESGVLHDITGPQDDIERELMRSASGGAAVDQLARLKRDRQSTNRQADRAATPSGDDATIVGQ